MNTADIRALYDYNQWANRIVLRHAALVTEEQLTAPAPFPSGSLKGTLLHILAAEWNWLRRWQGNSPSTWLADEPFPTLDSIRERWEDEERRMDAFIAGLRDDDLQRPLRYRTLDGQEDSRVLWPLMLHVVNHGTQHRAEAAAMLTGYGHSPGDIDMIIYLRQQWPQQLADKS